MEPEFQQQHAFIDQHALEPDDAFAGPHQLILGRLAGDAVEHGVGMPGAEQDPHPPLRRQRTPVAPHARTLAFLVRHLAERGGDDVPRVHPFVQDVERLALPGTVHAADDDHHRELGLRQQVVLQRQQARAEQRLLAVIIRLGNLVAEFSRFEHVPRLSPLRPQWPLQGSRTAPDAILYRNGHG